MARLALSKSALQHERQNLQMYQQFLPSLDLKRRQLMAEHSRAQEALAKAQEQVATLIPDTGKTIPMLANTSIKIGRLVQIESVKIGEENVVGVKLPVLDSVTAKREEYSLLAKPHWVDAVADRLQHILELHMSHSSSHRASASAQSRHSSDDSTCQSFRQSPNPWSETTYPTYSNFSGRL